MAGSPLNPQYAPLYVAAGRAAHIPPSVLAGVADVETNGGQNISTSSTGAQGLMQFEPGTAKGLGVNPYNARSAIFGAAKLLNQYGYQQNPLRAIGAYNGGPGNPQYGYANQVMASAKRLSAALMGYGAGTKGRAPGAPPITNATITTPGHTTTSFTGGQTDTASAGLAALMSGADKPIDASGHVSTDNVLGRLEANLASGQFTTPSSASSTTTPGTTSSVRGGLSGSGYVNPIAGFTIGRTDMGVDASARPGTPIRAIGDSRVIAIRPNWYAGQPYLQMQILNGPKAGHYYYVAEQINPTVRPGQIVKAGQTIATYAASGTGIEIGWGSKSSQTLAQAEGNTGDSQHNNAPAGIDFRNFLNGLRTGRPSRGPAMTALALNRALNPNAPPNIPGSGPHYSLNLNPNAPPNIPGSGPHYSLNLHHHSGESLGQLESSLGGLGAALGVLRGSRSATGVVRGIL